MTELINKEDFETLREMLNNDENALKLCIDLLFVGHLWDDLIDQDQDRAKEEINKAFYLTLNNFDNNPFYCALRSELQPLITSACLMWLDSTSLEKKDKLTAFIIRQGLAQIIHYCIYRLGGYEWVREHGPKLWELFKLPDKYQEFIKE